MIRRWLPAPLLSATLAVLWLALARSASPGNLLIAATVGLLLPAIFAPLRPERPRMKRPGVVLKLIAVVAWDTLLSHIEVFTGIVTHQRRSTHCRFVRVPLELRDPNGLACLCAITTFIPGSLWCQMSPDRASVVIHAWNAPDEAAFIAHYKQRYEHPLMEIFE
jgi:multicomponent K+:H+ antiporter subunit E